MEKIMLLLPYEVLLLGFVSFFAGLTLIYLVLFRSTKRKKALPQTQGIPVPSPSEPIKSGRAFILSKYHKARPVLWLILPLATLITIWGFLSFIMRTPIVIKSTPVFDGKLNSFDEPLRFILNVPVDFSHIAIHTNPEFPFEWEGKPYVRGLRVGREILIRPTQSLPPGTKVMVYLSNLKNPVSTDFGSEHLLEFSTPPLPDIVDSIPKPGAYDISSDIAIQLKLSSTDTPQSAWDVKIEPMEFVAINRSWDDMLTLTFAKPLKQNTTYNVSIFRTPVTVDLQTKTALDQGDNINAYEFSFSTVKAPLISTFHPSGDNVVPVTPIEIAFDDPMNEDSVVNRFIITPEVKGSFFWNDEGKTLRFQPDILEKNTEYAITLQKGILSRLGGELEEDIAFRFRTLGVVAISSTSPADETKDVSTSSSINIRFNQEVAKKSAEERFSIDPPVSGTLTWDGLTMIFTPDAPFDFGRTYSYRIGSGIQSVYGFDSATSYTYRFTTAPQEYAINVPYFKQQENFTCNIAAIRMLLAFRGITKTEAELKSEAGTNGSRGNGNPNLGYVANYGTYWDAIGKLVGQYRSYRIFKEWDLPQLLTHVQNGVPVMIWGQNGWSNPHEISWTASDGTDIYAINGMHSYIVRGWRGPIENPTHILVNDPWRGVYALSTSEFMRRWNFFKVALIVD